MTNVPLLFETPCTLLNNIDHIFCLALSSSHYIYVYIILIYFTVSVILQTCLPNVGLQCIHIATKNPLITKLLLSNPPPPPPPLTHAHRPSAFCVSCCCRNTSFLEHTTLSKILTALMPCCNDAKT